MTREGTKLSVNRLYVKNAADIVADPSAPDAFVEGIMEGKDGHGTAGILSVEDLGARKTYQTINTLVDSKTVR